LALLDFKYGPAGNIVVSVACIGMNSGLNDIILSGILASLTTSCCCIMLSILLNSLDNHP